jgi:hypothetical protein
MEETQEHDGGRTTEEIKRDIERRRASIARTVDRAGQKLHHMRDWREQLREHPYGALALAAFAGFTLAGMSSRRPRSSVEHLAMLLTGAALPRPGLAGGLRAAATALATQSFLGMLRRRMENVGTAEERTR